MLLKVYELAGELGLTSKELISRLEAMKVPVRNHMSALDDATVARVRRAASTSADGAGAGPSGPLEARRGPAKAVDEEKIKQSAFLQ